jgi:rod shape-determining protein MreD
MQALRPPLVAMTTIYWCMMWPGRFGLGSAWLAGIALDVLTGSLLGQHALGLSLVAFLTVRFHLQIRIFPLWQLTTTVLALLACDAFVRFWVDGLAGVGWSGWQRWIPVIAGTVCWPPWMALMDGLRIRLETSRNALE